MLPVQAEQQDFSSDLCDGFSQACYEVKPKFALVVYSNGNGERTTVTRHQISNNQLKSGVPISPESIIDTLSSACTSNSQIEEKSMIEVCVLAQNYKSITWHRPRQKRSFFVYDNLLTVDIPPLIFKFSTDGSLKVAALRFNKRPTSTDPLYHAPFGNVYDSTSVCLGSMKLPKSINSDTIELVEKEFFSTKFTHTNHDGILRKKKANRNNGLESFLKKKSNNGEPVKISELNRIVRPQSAGVSSLISVNYLL